MGTQVSTPVAWDQRRWLRILERIEFRQVDVGLRFWGPPLWLEVTMTGPDSDQWSTAAVSDVPDPSWDWQSTDSCDEAMALADAGADDQRLLEVAGRYTVENLVLNATHEIGEWLRFDARRLFAAHGSRTGTAPEIPPTGDGAQGNGLVSVEVRFDEPAPMDPEHKCPAGPTAPDGTTLRAAALAAAWRFTYLPGKLISYGARGPTITELSDGDDAARRPWEFSWSDESHRLAAGPDDDFVASVQRDVHRMLVLYETQRICDAFYVDGRRPWRLLSPGAPVGTIPGLLGDERDAVGVAITYDR